MFYTMQDITKNIHLEAVNTFLRVISNQDGKDKLLKSFQYLARILMTINVRKKQKMERVSMLKTLSSNISLARSTFRLGCWLNDVQLFTTCRNKELFFLTVNVINNILDDICCFYRHGIISNRKIFEFSDLYSSRLWLISIIYDIFKTNEKIHKQLVHYKQNSDDKTIQIPTESLLSLLKSDFDMDFAFMK